MVDVERGEQLLAYDNCAFSGRDRTGLAADPVCPNMAVSVAVNGKGLTLLDLRMPLPLDFVYDVSELSKPEFHNVIVIGKKIVCMPVRHMWEWRYSSLDS